MTDTDPTLQLDQLYPVLLETLHQFGEEFEFKSLKELLEDYHAQLNRTQPNLREDSQQQS